MKVVGSATKLLLSGLAVIALCLTPLAAQASIGGPYSPDVNTVALYHLDGSLVDASGNGVAASLIGTTDWVTTAKYGGGLDVSGGTYGGFTAYVPAFDANAGCTVEGWFKIPDLASPDGRQFLLSGGNGGGAPGFFLAADPDGTVEYYIRVDPWTFAGFATPAGAVTANQWFHIALTFIYSPTVPGLTGPYPSCSLFINNKLMGTQPALPIPFSNLVVGRCPWDEEGSYGVFQGQVDEVRMSNGIRTHFSTDGYGGPYTTDADTVALLHLNGSLADSSGNGLDGTLVGTTNNWITSAQFGGGLQVVPGETVSGGFTAPVGTLYADAGYTVEGWFKPSAPPSAYGRQAMFNFPGASRAITLATWVVDNGALDCITWGPNGQNEVWTAPGLITPDKWTHVALAVDADKVNIYIDNVLQVTMPDPPDPSAYLLLGSVGWAPGDPYSAYSGLVDEVRVSSVVRTDFSSLITATPALSSAGGTSLDPISVTVTCTTPGSTIHYTTTGTDPTESDPVVVSGSSVLVDHTLTLKAKAFTDGYGPSNVVAGYYIVPSTLNEPNVIGQAQGIMVDGILNEWAAGDFVPMTYRDGTTEDLAEAYYAAKWSPADNVVFVAIKVRDTAHVFEDTFNSWNTKDAVEIYMHTNGTGPWDFSASQRVAQQYIVNIHASDHSSVWTYMGWNIPVPTANGSVFAGSVGTGANADWLYYEAAIVPFDSQPTVTTTLHAGEIIGVDAVAIGNNGSYTGKICANSLATLAAYDYSDIGLHILAPSTVSSLQDVKAATDGSSVMFSGVVTAAFDGYFYVEAPERTSGIRVQKAGHSATVGNTATIIGTVTTNDASGERYVDATVVTEATGTALKPLGLVNKSLGGGDKDLQAGVVDGTGLNNIGLLVKTTGRVSNVSGSRFQIDDGSGVLVSAVVSTGSAPTGGSYVAVEGIAACEKISGAIQRLILVNHYDTIAE